MSESLFIGRKDELKSLEELLQRKVSGLVVIKGRRRIGKSRLVEEFGKKGAFYHFSGLAPTEGVTAQDQRDDFSRRLSEQAGLPQLALKDWSELFSLLASQCKTGRCILLFDEITWMAQDDATFLSKLKSAWDLEFKKNPKLILVLCGSVSTWIEKNIISSTAFFGRISLSLCLEELPLEDSNKLLDALGFQRSTLEKLMLLSMTGGVPWYLEQIQGQHSAVENIKNLCFKKDGILTRECDRTFHDLFGKRSELYRKIASLLAKGDLDYDQISEKLSYSKGTALSSYLEDLIQSSYVTRYRSWSLNTGVYSPKQFRYRLSDNFLRFYFRVMHSKMNAISEDFYRDFSLSSLPGWSALQGLQFESLVLKNRAKIHETLRISPVDILANGTYFQRQTLKKEGCQIDYLIQTRFRTLYVCEIKFSQQSIGASVISDVKRKIAALALPRGMAAIPVLIHASSVTTAVAESEFFFNVIDFSLYLEGK